MRCKEHKIEKNITMKLMAITTNPKYAYDNYKKSGWNLLPSLFTKKGIEYLGIGKYEWHKFYFEYLRFKPDLIIVEWVPPALIPLFFKKLKLINCPITLNWGDYYAEMMSNNLKHPRILVRWMEKYAVKNADFITSVSKRNEKIAKRYGKEVFYIPHGCFKSNNKKTKINLNKLKTKRENLKIIYLGEQTKWKKVDEIIQAVKGLDCDLFLFGSTNPEMQNLAKNHKNIHFMGYADELEVRSLLKQANILINPSNQDCNYKFFEYISVGKPILAYDGLPKYLFKHKENAYLTKDFKKGLIELIKNKELRKKLEKNIKKIKTYNWDEIINKYIEIYERKII